MVYYVQNPARGYLSGWEFGGVPSYQTDKRKAFRFTWRPEAQEVAKHLEGAEVVE